MKTDFNELTAKDMTEIMEEQQDPEVFAALMRQTWKEINDATDIELKHALFRGMIVITALHLRARGNEPAGEALYKASKFYQFPDDVEKTYIILPRVPKDEPEETVQ